MRTSVSALRLLVEAVRDGVLDAVPGSTTVDQMFLHVRLLSELTGQLDGADVTRAAGDGVRPVEIAGLLEHWGSAMQPKAAARRVELRRSVARDLPLIECRPGHVSRLLLNLLDNAIRHTPSGGLVMVRAVAHACGVQVQINDTGPGLPPEIRQRLDGSPPTASALANGRQLGLSIEQSIVQWHGGALWAAPTSRGTSLRFYLPAASARGVA